MNKLSLNTINAMSETAFVEAFSTIVEHSDWVARAVYTQKPFANLQALQKAFTHAIAVKGAETWKMILNLHPELSGKEATAGTLTEHSTSEQARLGLTALSKEHFTHMQRFNQAYRQRFGFPFVICVKLVRDLPHLFAEQERRIKLSTDEELRNGIAEVYKIAELRLSQVVSD